jgi:hypothetical protein
MRVAGALADGRVACHMQRCLKASACGGHQQASRHRKQLLQRLNRGSRTMLSPLLAEVGALDVLQPVNTAWCTVLHALAFA